MENRERRDFLKAIILDDEVFVCEYLQTICDQIMDINVVERFHVPQEMLEYVAHYPIDLAFMDVEMPGMNGIEAARRLREIAPNVAIIFVTGHENYAFEAFGLDAVSYLLKPCTAQEVERAVEKAVRLFPTVQPRVRIQTFGQFVLFIDNEPYRIANKKAKELLALLIDCRGEIVTMEQAIDVLWEDRPYDDTVKQLYRRAVITLNQLMKEKDLDFFVSNRGSCHIIPSKLECDYYQFLQGNPNTVKLYMGEYMSQYSWAEDTIGNIESFLVK